MEISITIRIQETKQAEKSLMKIYTERFNKWINSDSKEIENKA